MSVPEALADLRPLREHAAFRRLWIGVTASGLGAQMSAFAIAYYIWDVTRDPVMVGLAGLFTAVPLILVTLLGTAFTDHIDRRRLAGLATWGLLATSLAMAAVAAVPPGARPAQAHGVSAYGWVWGMLALTGLSAALSALATPARRSIIPQMLPAARLPAGLALNHLGFQLALLLGPALGGLISAAWGVTACFVIDTVTFVAALIGIAGLPPVPPSARAGRAGPAAVWEGLRFAARTPPVRGAFLADLCAAVLAMPVALFPVINEERFGGSPVTLGLLTSALAAGGVLASALSGLVTRYNRPGAVHLACVAAWGVALAGVALSHDLPVALGLLALAGAADTWAVVTRGLIVQLTTPDSHRGRITALEHLVGAAGPRLGNLRAGLVAGTTSGPTALLIGGLTCLTGVVLVNALTPQLRRFTLPGAGPPGRR